MNFNLKKDHLAPIYLQKLTNSTQRPVLSFMYNPGLILWLNTAEDAFLWREIKKKNQQQQKKAMQHVHTELVDSPSENHY